MFMSINIADLKTAKPTNNKAPYALYYMQLLNGHKSIRLWAYDSSKIKVAPAFKGKVHSKALNYFL